jgi:hypothetical protein
MGQLVQWPADRRRSQRGDRRGQDGHGRHKLLSRGYRIEYHVAHQLCRRKRRCVRPRLPRVEHEERRHGEFPGRRPGADSTSRRARHNERAVQGLRDQAEHRPGGRRKQHHLRASDHGDQSDRSVGDVWRHAGFPDPQHEFRYFDASRSSASCSVRTTSARRRAIW